jgi:penicillin-binding protein 1C
VAIEDAEFYQHRGIRPISILRAILANLGAGGFSQGGSTITQQVVKNSILTSEKKLSRKLKEWVLAIKLERTLSKEEILNVYLNETPYGGSVYGVEEASKTFFGKKSSDVTLAEAAYLASLPQAPTYYSPYGAHRKELDGRKNLVLQKMLGYRFISKLEYEEAEKEVVKFREEETVGIKAPHFSLYILEALENMYGRKALEERGLKVITSLNYDLQKKAEEIVKEYALRNEIEFNAENAGLVATDPKTGDVLVMVGSRDYFDKTIDGNVNIALAKRQPGSAFKPFVYATAFLKGYTPETMVFDLRTQFDLNCAASTTEMVPDKPTDETFDPCYTPENYDGKYRGPISLRSALAQSINVPAIKVLYLAGLRDSLKTVRDMGIGTLGDQDRYGLTLVLGGGEVTLLDLTSAYGVFANDGVRNPSRAILEIQDESGKIIYQPIARSTEAIPSSVARQISDILSDNKARAPSFGEASPLHFPGHQVSAKTGTTNDYRDAWIVGYTPSIAVGAWAGNNDNSPMEKRVAGFIVAPMWNKFIREVLTSLPTETFPKPPDTDLANLKPVLAGFWQGGRSYFIDSLTKKLATEYTPTETREKQVVREVHSILYWVDRNNPRGPEPENPLADAQFELWEKPIREWAEKEGLPDETEAVIPKELDSIHGPGLGPRPSLVTPSPSTEYLADGRVTVTLLNQGRFPLKKVDVFLNNVFVGSSGVQPFSFSFVPAEVEGVANINELRVVVYDAVYNKTELNSTLKTKF